MATIFTEFLFRDELFWVALVLWVGGAVVGDSFAVGSQSVGDVLAGLGLLFLVTRFVIGGGVILQRTYRAGRTGYEERQE